MSRYQIDRQFTDWVHENIALNFIYKYHGWTVIEPRNKDGLKALDTEHAVDYLVRDGNGKLIRIQERFRRSNYISSNEATIRYERKNPKYESQKKSEFFKIISEVKNEPKMEFYFVYGVVNQTGKGLAKYVVIDLRALVRHFEDGDIILCDFDISTNCFFGLDRKIYLRIIDTPNIDEMFLSLDVGLLQICFDDVVKFNYGFAIKCDKFKGNSKEPTSSQINYLWDLARTTHLTLWNTTSMNRGGAEYLIGRMYQLGGHHLFDTK